MLKLSYRGFDLFIRFDVDGSRIPKLGGNLTAQNHHKRFCT